MRSFRFIRLIDEEKENDVFRVPLDQNFQLSMETFKSFFPNTQVDHSDDRIRWNLSRFRHNSSRIQQVSVGFGEFLGGGFRKWPENNRKLCLKFRPESSAKEIIGKSGIFYRYQNSNEKYVVPISDQNKFLIDQNDYELDLLYIAYRSNRPVAIQVQPPNRDSPSSTVRPTRSFWDYLKLVVCN
ncbi:unnamed protein product [Adineta ricciae]|uniref:Uncharacterized protein n=1 Tax=Adineta ricciae TaxID=249248 RepID=A0A814SM45_ADIRI|nr:unnamed protein product [Adineta ricciae]